MFELFGAASTVEQALYTFKKDPELVLKLQELKVELRLEKTLREDLRLMSAFLFEDVRPVSEFQAHEEEEQWRANVLSQFLVHIFECLYLWPFFAEPLGAGCNHN
jgi:Leu/Phe-tRNA-protein transferase